MQLKFRLAYLYVWRVALTLHCAMIRHQTLESKVKSWSLLKITQDKKR